jgi:hypothetical protein
MGFPVRTSLFDRARETADRLQAGGEQQPPPPSQDNGEPSRMAEAVKESAAAVAPAQGLVASAENDKAIGELTPNHTPSHAPQNSGQWRAQAEASPQRGMGLPEPAMAAEKEPEP